MSLLARIADRVLGRPLLIHPTKAEVILSVLGDRIGVDVGSFDLSVIPEEFKALRDGKPVANRLVGEPGGKRTTEGRLREYLYNVQGGVAIIPVVGTLINRGAFVGDDGSGFMSYEGLAYQVSAALEDDQVHSILLDIDSPGGEAGGMFSLSDQIRAARNVKPITALVNDMAASAAYGIASAASEIVVSPSSITGSIGVVLMHVDRSKEMEMRGRKATLIYAGAHKVDGNQYGPLSAEVRSDLQSEVDTFYDRFIETVMAGRSSLSADAIRATEARTFIGAAAVDKGLADRVGSFADELSRLTAFTPTRSQGKLTMTNTTDKPAATVDADAVRAASQQAATDAKARINAILTCDEAKGREPQAQSIALTTDLPVDAAKALLATFPVASAAKPVVPSIAERSAGYIEAGVPGTKMDAKASWAKSLSRAGAKMPSTSH